MFAIIILGDHKTILPKALQNDNIIIFMVIVLPSIFVGLAIFFYLRAMNVAIYAPLIEFESRFAWYDSLTEIAVRKSKGKHKFGYRVDQIKEIEAKTDKHSFWQVPPSAVHFLLLYFLQNT